MTALSRRPLAAGMATCALLGTIAIALAADPPAQRTNGAPPRSNGPGGAPTANETFSLQLLQQGDIAKDGTLSVTELLRLTENWYDRLSNHGADEVTQDVLARRYAEVLEPTPRLGGVMAAMTLAAQPEVLFLAADRDKDGALGRSEFTESFQRWFMAWGGSEAVALPLAKLRAGLDATLPATGGGFGPPPGGPAGGPPREMAGDFSPRQPVTALTPRDEQSRFVLMKGYRMDPVLTEPNIAESMAISFDGNGRMYVVELRTYMQDLDGSGTLLPQSRISRHEDRDGDGVYETHTLFADHLVFPRFAFPLDGDAILTMESNQRDIVRLTDTDGDGVADRREIWAKDVNNPDANVEHMSASLTWAMDNHLYLSAANFRFRIRPDGSAERESISPNMGQWGVSQDDDGRLFFQGGEIGVPVQFQTVPVYGSFVNDDSFEAGYTEPWGLGALADFQGGMNYVREDQNLKRVTGAAGSQVFRGDRLPRDLQGQYLSGEPVARIVRRSEIEDVEGLTRLRNVYQGEKAEFIRSTDPLFRPVDLQTAPDGTLYVVDTYRGIVQESQWTGEGTYLRRKVQQYALERQVGRGRIWRLTHEGIERDRNQPRMLKQSAAELVPYLDHPNGWWRDQAQKLLVLRQDRSVVPALKRLAAKGTLNGRLHALWTLEGLEAIDAGLVRAALADTNPRIRAAGLRVGESLVRAGDRSLAGDYAKLARTDEAAKVVIQSMLSLNHVQAPGTADLVRMVTASSRLRGVREFGDQILTPRGRIGPMARGQFDAYPEAQRAMLKRGQETYASMCVTCHSADGKGTPVPDTPQRMGAALAGSSTLQGDPRYAIRALLHGLSGSKGDGKTYLGAMVGLGANNSDQWVADVLSYVRNSFGNAATFVTTEEVRRVRAEDAGKANAWAIPELLKSVRLQLPYRPDWQLTASHHAESATFAINSSGSVSWTSGEPQAAGQWYAITLTEPTRLGGVELVAADQTGYPRRYTVEVSDEGSQWRRVYANGLGHSQAVRAFFAGVNARHLRIRLDAPDSSSGSVPAWSIQKLRLYAPPAEEGQTTASAMKDSEKAAPKSSATRKKRVLLVTTSIGFRHPSVPFAEQALRDILSASGEFEVVSTSDHPDFPQYPPAMDWELAGKANAGPDMSKMKWPGGPPPIASKLASTGGTTPAQGVAPAGDAATLAKVKHVLADLMSPTALRDYDGVVFVVTNGELPLPDPAAFLDWVKAGHGFVGIHSASDSLHGVPRYIEMLGAEFDHHGQQEIVQLANDAAGHPLASGYATGMPVDEEWYLFRPGYDRRRVHSLVSMTEHPNDKTPGHYPVSWCKPYGNGRVFYTSQGHRPDGWSTEWIGTDGLRTNSAEAVNAFRSQLLGALRWTTGLTTANCTP